MKKFIQIHPGHFLLNSLVMVVTGTYLFIKGDAASSDYMFMAALASLLISFILLVINRRSQIL